MKSDEKPIANPSMVLREEFDDWAVLFDPDSGKAFGVNPVGVFVWKRLDAKHTVDDILTELNNNSDNVPDNARDEIIEFIDSLIEHGYAGVEMAQG